MDVGVDNVSEILTLVVVKLLVATTASVIMAWCFIQKNVVGAGCGISAPIY